MAMRNSKFVCKVTWMGLGLLVPTMAGAQPGQSADGSAAVAPQDVELVFPARSAALDQDGSRKLDGLARWLRADSSRRVVVEHASVEGDEAASLLAGDRMSLVRTYLRDEGADPSRVSLPGDASAAGGQVRVVRVAVEGAAAQGPALGGLAAAGQPAAAAATAVGAPPAAAAAANPVPTAAAAGALPPAAGASPTAGTATSATAAANVAPGGTAPVAAATAGAAPAAASAVDVPPARAPASAPSQAAVNAPAAAVGDATAGAAAAAPAGAAAAAPAGAAAAANVAEATGAEAQAVGSAAAPAVRPAAAASARPAAPPPEVRVRPVPMGATPAPGSRYDFGDSNENMSGQALVWRQPSAPAFTTAGFGVTVGGGVTGFWDRSTSDVASVGGAWEARLVYGTRTVLAAEAAYVGSAQSLNASGMPEDALLVGHGAEGNMRLNFSRAAVQPYVFGGAGWTNYSVTRSGGNSGGMGASDNVFHVPVGLGLTLRNDGLIFDVRGTARLAFDETLMNGMFGNRDGNLDSWTASARLGWEF